eukprot:TRINITY_DN11568_c0_g1_i2.p1 TRINITY_DN11568_c0_g1~~TRINITY_DN11568_c0_g1_i2.p1  ORF type:complete len:996 (+),score=231.43 TRINITY_DN11568_c0_g1_i2:47-2989(+)
MSASGGGTPRGAWAGRRRGIGHTSGAQRPRASTPGPGQYEQDHNTISRDATERAWRGGMHAGFGGQCGPRGALVNKAVMTEHEGLEEEVARLNARIAVLVRAGADYRAKVDDLFMTTKEESERSAMKTTQQLTDLEKERDALRQETSVATAMLEKERAEHEELKAEVRVLRENILAADRRVEDARSAQRRVEEELEATAAEAEAFRMSRSADEERIQRTERECAEVTEHMAAQQSQLARLQMQADEVKVQQSLVADLRDEQRRWVEKSASLEELIGALQNRNQDVEAEVAALREEQETMVPQVQYQEVLDTCERAEEKLKSAEASNRVLHREADRRKQTADDATAKLHMRDAMIESLEEKLAAALAVVAPQRGADAAPSSGDAADETAPSDALLGKVVEESLPKKEELQALYDMLREEHELLAQQLAMQTEEEGRVRALCHELHEDVEKLTDENEALRSGLSTIEKSFGKLIPDDLSGSGDDPDALLASLAALSNLPASPRPACDERGASAGATPRRNASTARGIPGGLPSPDRADPHLRYLALHKRDAFSQTTLLGAAGRGVGAAGHDPAGVVSPDRLRKLAHGEFKAQQQVALLKRDVEALNKRRVHERNAAAAAFKATLKELIKSFRQNALDPHAHPSAGGAYSIVRDADGVPTFRVDVEVTYPAEAIAVYPLDHSVDEVVTPGRTAVGYSAGADFDAPLTHALHPSGGSQLRDELALLRRRTQEAEAYARRSEGLAAMAAQLKRENEDLTEHVRRLTSSDPHARTVHGLLAATIRAAEKRVNETLSRFKTVLRNRCVLVHQLHAAMIAVHKLRDCAGELHLYLRSALAPADHLAPDIFPRLAALSRSVDDATAAHRVVATECFTLWERTSLGLASETLKPRAAARDLQAELRASEDLLHTLWVTFTLPGSHKRSPRSLYAPVTSVPMADHYSSPRRGDVMHPPQVHVGRLQQSPARSHGDTANSYARRVCVVPSTS